MVVSLFESSFVGAIELLEALEERIAAGTLTEVLARAQRVLLSLRCARAITRRERATQLVGELEGDYRRRRAEASGTGQAGQAGQEAHV